MRDSYFVIQICLLAIAIFTFYPADSYTQIPKSLIQYRVKGLNMQETVTPVLDEMREHILCLPVPQLAEALQGTGKAKLVWESLKCGIDPLESDALSEKAKGLLRNALGQKPLIATTIISESLAECGTRKLLLRLEDGLEIESVLIPSYKFNRTTLCVSTQVGCDRGCAFCLTGKMGLMRNLTAPEILGQVIRAMQVSKQENMPPLLNIVFMGMGDAGRNIVNVKQAVECLVDGSRFSFGQSKVTVSTVGPSPEVFDVLATLPASIAWSLHSPNDEIRKQLVPSTKHTTLQLRDALLTALQTHRVLKKRTIMIAFTLIEGINDRDEDAIAIADFVRPMFEIAPKIAIDLIPYNDIHTHNFRRPSRERINEFQHILIQRGFFCSVRVTRGDDESAACGMLATKKRPTKQGANSSMNSDILM